MQKIGIIGSGAVGVALAKGFLKYGYPTMIASRSEEKQQTLKETLGGEIQTGSFEEAAKFGDVVVLAVAGHAALEAVNTTGPGNLAGKTIIDATNPISGGPDEAGVLPYFTSLSESLMEQLQSALPDAKFVKAFSCVGNAHMVDPDFDSTPTMFICGNDNDAKADVTGILTQFGWEVEDMGAVQAARAIEPLAMLWCIPIFTQGKDKSRL